MTGLIHAARNGHQTIVKTLVDAGVSIDAKYEDEMTALMYAARNGHTTIVKTLVESGASIDTKDEDGMTALDIAINKDKIEIATFLKITAHFNESPSIDSLHEELVTNETKQYYIDNKKTLDPLFKFRKSHH